MWHTHILNIPLLFVLHGFNSLILLFTTAKFLDYIFHIFSQGIFTFEKELLTKLEKKNLGGGSVV